MTIHIRHDQNHMATTFEFLLSCEVGDKLRAESVLTESHALVTELELELSEFLPESPIFQLNHAPAGKRVRLSHAGISLLEKSRRFHRTTGGAFNAGAKSTYEAGSESGQNWIEWDARSLEAWRLAEGARVGFGAIGKGYALDRVRAVLEAEGFRDYMLSAGGSSIVLSGFAGPGDPWKFGWSWKKDEAGAPLGLRLTHQGETVSIGVSGTHEKGEHIIGAGGPSDPSKKLRSALVALSGSAADADALSTALFVSGWEKNTEIASRFVADCGVPPAMACIDSEEVPCWNGIFQKLWGAHPNEVRIPRSNSPFSLSSLSLLLLPALTLLSALPLRADDGDVDLSAMGGDAFTPYILDRSQWWMLLPAFALVMVLVHLRNTRRKS